MNAKAHIDNFVRFCKQELEIIGNSRNVHKAATLIFLATVGGAQLLMLPYTNDHKEIAANVPGWVTGLYFFLPVITTLIAGVFFGIKNALRGIAAIFILFGGFVLVVLAMLGIKLWWNSED
jgi:hypothetical protein